MSVDDMVNLSHTHFVITPASVTICLNQVLGSALNNRFKTIYILYTYTPARWIQVGLASQ